MAVVVIGSGFVLVWCVFIHSKVQTYIRAYSHTYGHTYIQTHRHTFIQA